MATALLYKFQSLFPLSWTNAQGHFFTIRPISEGDLDDLKRFAEALSYTTKYLRFGHGNFQPDINTLKSVCCPDTSLCTHLLITTTEAENQKIVASGRYVVQGNGINAEFALEVLDLYQHHGLGHHLLEFLELDAKKRGIKKMHGQILATNQNMLNFVMDCGYTIHYHPEEEYLKLAIKTL